LSSAVEIKTIRCG